MKPRERKSQKQSSRLYLRYHDHRDVIFEQKFHVAMFLYKIKRDKDGKPIGTINIESRYPSDDVRSLYMIPERRIYSGDGIDTCDHVWIKYPNKGMLYMDRGWIDLERQYNYGGNFGWFSGSDIKGLLMKDYVLFMIGNSSVANTGYDVTHDGIIWHKDPLGHKRWDEYTQKYILEFIPRSSERFGDSSLCHINNVGNGRALIVHNLEYDKEKHIISPIRKIQVTLCTDNYTSEDEKTATELTRTRKDRHYRYLGYTTNGCIVLEGMGITILKYALDSEGNIDHLISTSYSVKYTFKHIYMIDDMLYIDYQSDMDFSVINNADMWYLSNVETGYYGFSFLRYGTFNIISYMRPSVLPNGKVMFSVNVGVTRNEGVSWTYTSVDAATFNAREEIPAGNSKTFLFFSQGKFYLLQASQAMDFYETKMYESTNGVAWNQIHLPKWVDVPIISDGGMHTNRTPSKEKLRIAIKPADTPDYDIFLYNMFGSNFVLFKEGEINNDPSEFWIYLSSNDYAAVFDNKYFAASSNSFAVEKHYDGGEMDPRNVYNYQINMSYPYLPNIPNDAPDFVNDYDYCAPPGGFEGEEPDLDLEYIWYIWNDENKYELVDRHLSTYAGYTIQIVNELPEVGQHQILYGIKTDLNANPLYDYYIYDALESSFVTITDLTLYSKHTVVVVPSLPITGAINVIYAVPKSLDGYSTNMYIWNPDAISYEEKGKDDQGNPIYVEIHGAFEDINTTEYDMTGKSYRTINVVKLPDRGYVGIIYISEQKYTPEKKAFDDSAYNYYQWDFYNSKYFLISPTIDTSKYKIIDVTVLDPPPAGTDPDEFLYNVYRILKKNDTHQTKANLYPSEEDLKKYLKKRTDNSDQWLDNKGDLPFVGVPNVFYIVKEIPGSRTGFYTVYMWKQTSRKYIQTNSYEYLIADPPTEEEKDRLITIVEDI